MVIHSALDDLKNKRPLKKKNTLLKVEELVAINVSRFAFFGGKFHFFKHHLIYSFFLTINNIIIDSISNIIIIESVFTRLIQFHFFLLTF